ncbi:BON domain-containing protein [Caulobacter sp. 602-1]|uniref:BON domain-containing protein n=1 Tax=Caulobacter sp. 602-1 TaxID=2492472 RepID=UPI000F62FF3E|nr:BON domain-containing protein [Caulobacter sp. 602-1]RRN66315.1 BON domain-containing protein [Caulobacter sp. 602-1]
MPQRWNDREGRFDVEADGDFDRQQGYGYDAARRRDPAYDTSHRNEGGYRGERGPRRHGGEFLRAAQAGGDIGYGRVGGHDFGGATGDYGSSGYASRTADYGDERYFDGRDRDRPDRDGAYGRDYNPYRSFSPRDQRPRHEERTWFDRARDEVSSWMGDHDALRRREADGAHRGRGPKGYRRSDERIREDVSDRLTDDSWLDANGIEVAVSDGDVTLTGTVRSREDKRRAEALAESVSGVDNVQNNLRVDCGTDTTATTVPASPLG